MKEKSYLPGTHPDLPPPTSEVGVIGWARKNLFATPADTIFTLLALYVLYSIVPSFMQWAFFDAFESGPMGRRALQAINHHLQHMQELLFKREHEDPLDRMHRDQGTENLDIAIAVRILGFLQGLCDGCFHEMQHLLRTPRGRIPLKLFAAEAYPN